MTGPGDDLQRLLSARKEIDRTLLERHSREVAILFTDIVGSTAFYEARGDIEGLARVHRHNELLFPLVEAHGGRVVKTIGDALMAVFDDPPRAVDCAAAMQRALDATAPAEGEEPIEVRIGVHAGRVLVDGDDVFGDTVNTAARVAGAAAGREVLLSESLFRSLPEGEGHLAEPRGALTFKGKAEPFPVVALRWEQRHRPPLDDAPAELFVLELGLGPRGLRVSVLDGATDKGTIKAYGEVALGPADLDALTGHFDTLAHGGGDPVYVDEVARAGRELFERALTERAQRRLQETGLSYLRLHLDDDLVQLPWELLHDGERFLGLRFAAGRLVAARADAAPWASAPGASRGHLLVVASPSGDLPAATREGQTVARLLEDAGLGEVRLVEGPLSRARFLDEVRGCRLLHFAGHTQRDPSGEQGGFRLDDGVVTAADLAAALGDRAPELVFANSCRASTSRGWHESQRAVGGLASSLLMRGVRHYLAPAWEVPDDDALFFALRFYEHALAGAPLGEAVRRARVALHDGGGRPLSFAGYVLYGDPRERISGARRGSGELPAVRGIGITSGTPPAAPRAPSPRGSSSSPAPSPPASSLPSSALPAPVSSTKRSALPWLALAGAGIVACCVAVALLVRERPPTDAAVPPAAPATVGDKSAPMPRTGPLRLSILPFKNVGQDAELSFLEAGLAEVLVTDFGHVKDLQLIERGQIDVDIGEIEFSQSKYVDPKTKAALGLIKGAEVVVLGAFQRGGDRLRATARFVDVETGRILSAVRVDRPAEDVFELQDALAVKVRAELDNVRARVRP